VNHHTPPYPDHPSQTTKPSPFLHFHLPIAATNHPRHLSREIPKPPSHKPQASIPPLLQSCPNPWFSSAAHLTIHINNPPWPHCRIHHQPAPSPSTPKLQGT
jgi:hypothetical protein